MRLIWNTGGMDRHPREILESALALPESERADLAASLIRSLDSDVDEDANTAWAAEIQRRLRSIDNGEVTLIPWDDVISELRERKNG